MNRLGAGLLVAFIADLATMAIITIASSADAVHDLELPTIAIALAGAIAGVQVPAKRSG